MQTTKPQCLEASQWQVISIVQLPHEDAHNMKPCQEFLYGIIICSTSRKHIDTKWSKRSKLAQNQGHLYRCLFVRVCVCLCVRLWYIKKQWYTLLVTCGNECKWVDHDLQYLNSYLLERPSYPTANVQPNIACARPFSKNTLSVLYAKDMNHYSMILCAALALLWYESRRMSVTNQLVDASCKNLISMKFFWCLNRTKSLQDPIATCLIPDWTTRTTLYS